MIAAQSRLLRKEQRALVPLSPIAIGVIKRLGRVGACATQLGKGGLHQDHAWIWGGHTNLTQLQLSLHDAHKSDRCTRRQMQHQQEYWWERSLMSPRSGCKEASNRSRLLRYIAVGKSLMWSPSFPPLHTVHDSFPSHGVPSINRISWGNRLHFVAVRFQFCVRLCPFAKWVRFVAVNKAMASRTKACQITYFIDLVNGKEWFSVMHVQISPQELSCTDFATTFISVKSIAAIHEVFKTLANCCKKSCSWSRGPLIFPN